MYFDYDRIILSYLMNQVSPTKQNVLSRISRSTQVTSIIDVGVRECTAELIQQFPTLTQYLFEPVSLFFNAINRNYSTIPHELFPMALSDVDESLYLVLTALNGDGKATHSKISDEPVAVDGLRIVDCHLIEVRRFDSLELANSIPKNFLLKVDVDGKDLNVVKGFGDKLGLASVIIIECTYASALDRMGYLRSQGFELIDFVDLVYYGDSLYQFDAVFVRKDLVGPALRPPIASFKRELWSPLTFAGN